MPNKITITVERRRQSVRQPRRRGPVDGKRRRDYLARRRGKPGVTFYDLGYRRNDASVFVDLQNVGLMTPIVEDVRDGLEQYAALTVPDVLSIPAASFSSRYKKIDREAGNRYRLIFFLADGTVVHSNADSEHWSNDGLVLSGANVNTTFSVQVDGSATDVQQAMFSPLNFGSGVKITDNFDPNGTDVGFTFSGTEEVYLMPRPLHVGGLSQPGTLNPSANTRVLNSYVYHWPRSAFVEPSSPFFGLEFRGAGYTNLDPSLEAYNQTVQMIALLKSLPSARAWEVFGMGEGDFFFIPLTDFPHEEMTHPIPPGDTWGFSAAFLVDLDIESEPGLLRAIIDRGSQRYYVWRE